MGEELREGALFGGVKAGEDVPRCVEVVAEPEACLVVTGRGDGSLQVILTYRGNLAPRSLQVSAVANARNASQVFGHISGDLTIALDASRRCDATRVSDLLPPAELSTVRP